MAKSWQKTRKSLLEQIHHSEYSEMRTRSAMVHVFTMKMKLNNGVGKIKENVKQMNVMETMKTHLESQINQIQSDNIRLRAKIRNLSIRKCDAVRTLGNLRSKIVVVDERMETLQSKILKTRTYHQRLKKEKDDLLEKLRNSYGTFDTIKDRITSSAKNIRNLKIEVEYKKNCLNGLCDVILGTDNEIIDSTRARKYRLILAISNTFIRYNIDISTDLLILFRYHLSGPRVGPGPLGPRAPGILPPLPPPLDGPAG
ncbi:unnamed protein product [Nesidiocoris tenuis]|uniref:Uncharacterized protein n=1 Tax=Nesidiocoris tenuis TaxID=355587 RepID=A0A6H5G1V0_9HEMI|nr:unnamed protein product [Nesidiocoris tenuis]